ncbi:MAG: WYL domain-containing protein [Lachnospiraceae bacterium]
MLDEGKKANKDFEFHLQCLLDFYSKYYMFGEVGVFLLDRMENSSMSQFRLKHEHYMQALNDYNCIDLLYAIEQGKWCRIQYKHGMNGEKIELLCYPIEIRVGFRNGRESLVYYEPFKECYTTLRLEFIESIYYCEDQEIRQVLQKYDERYTNEFIDMEIENARRSIKNSWGISTTVGQQKNAMTPAILHKVKMRIAFDPKMEGFIRRRLQRECRLGQVVVNETEGYIDFEVEVTDAGELIPWVRSFYCRIISCEGIPEDRFEMKKDVEMMLQRIKPNYEEKRKDLSSSMISQLKLQKDRWQIPNEIQTVFPKGTPAQIHSKIFHEIFSARYYIIAESLMQKYRYNMSGDSFAEEKRNKQIIRAAVKKCEKQIGENTGRNINGDVKALLEDPQYGFVINKENSKESVNDRKHSEKYNFYELTGKILDMEEPAFYKDIIPLSEIEKRWLLSVLDDSKVDYFLNREEINAVKKSIQENVFTDKTFYDKAEHIHMEVLPMKYVKCFDQYHIQDNRKEKEYVMMLAKAIIDRKTVFIRYHTLTGKIKEGNYNPILLEFSKDHNRFQGYFEISKTNKIVIFNLSNIQNVEDTEEKFDIEQAKMNLQNYLNWQGLSTEIQFSDEKNTADRILTELAPWKKKCTYDKNSGIYQLKIDYQKSDQLDLVIRLMGYGSTIQFKKEDDPIYIETKRRLECQLKHMAENECK